MGLLALEVGGELRCDFVWGRRLVRELATGSTAETARLLALEAGGGLRSPAGWLRPWD